MVKALWLCGRARVNDRRVGSRLVGCNYWNVYVSRRLSKKSIKNPYTPVKPTSKTSPYSRSCKGSGTGEYRPRKVDTVCRHCGARARFQLSERRNDGRGRPRRVSVSFGNPRHGKYDELALKDLIDIANEKNRGEYQERLQIHFVPAKIYREV
jgi:hypothetical protein